MLLQFSAPHTSTSRVESPTAPTVCSDSLLAYLAFFLFSKLVPFHPWLPLIVSSAFVLVFPPTSSSCADVSASSHRFQLPLFQCSANLYSLTCLDEVLQLFIHPNHRHPCPTFVSSTDKHTNICSFHVRLSNLFRHITVPRSCLPSLGFYDVCCLSTAWVLAIL